MVKAYLRYELTDYFGACNTNRCDCYFDDKNKKILTGCGEYILIINIVKGTVFFTFIQSPFLQQAIFFPFPKTPKKILFFGGVINPFFLIPKIGEIERKISIRKNTQISYITKNFQDFPEFIACGCYNGDIV